jgi:hypothetical protein
MKLLFLWNSHSLFGKGLFLGIIVPVGITNPLHTGIDNFFQFFFFLTLKFIFYFDFFKKKMVMPKFTGVAGHSCNFLFLVFCFLKERLSFW